MKTTFLVLVLYFASKKCGGKHSHEQQSSYPNNPGGQAFMEIEHFQKSIDVVRVSQRLIYMANQFYLTRH